MRIRIRLSDKVLVIIAGASSLVLLAVFLLGPSAQQLISVGAVVYGVTFLAVYVISSAYSNRIIALAFRIEEMAAGNLTKPLRVTATDEIGQLANAVNELMARLQTGVVQHISARKELQQAKTDFVALASHQLRAPLSIIKWYVDFLITGDAGEVPPEQKKYLEQVYTANERLIDLVNALLDVSRIDLGTFTIEPVPTDIVEQAEAAIKRLDKEIVAAGVTLERRFAPVPVMPLDQRLIKMIFGHVLMNAIKYTAPGGKIRFSIKPTERDVYLTIADTGCGIPREAQPKIFTKLFRADNAQKLQPIGTGLGLYIVRAIMERSGGKIWLESPCLELLLEDGEKAAAIPLDKRHQGTAIHLTIPLSGMLKKRGTKQLGAGERK